MQDIYSLCYNPQITVADASDAETRPVFQKGGPIISLIKKIYFSILALKSKLAEGMSAGLPEPENALLQGMILNNRGELPEELKTSFSQAGITHIIAISGMNVAIISVIIINFLIACGLSRRWALIFSALTLVVYLILIGLPASALRAG